MLSIYIYCFQHPIHTDSVTLCDTHNSFSFSSPSALRLMSDKWADRSATAFELEGAVGEVVLEPAVGRAATAGLRRGMEPEQSHRRADSATHMKFSHDSLFLRRVQRAELRSAGHTGERAHTVWRASGALVCSTPHSVRRHGQAGWAARDILRACRAHVHVRTPVGVAI